MTRWCIIPATNPKKSTAKPRTPNKAPRQTKKPPKPPPTTKSPPNSTPHPPKNAHFPEKTNFFSNLCKKSGKTPCNDDIYWYIRFRNSVDIGNIGIHIKQIYFITVLTKRIFQMNKSIVAIAAAGLAGAIGFTSVASADVTVYGRVTAGAVHTDGDTARNDGSWNLGATGIDGEQGHLAGTRYGFKGSTDLGNGMEAGFQIERAIREGENPSVTQQRQNNVWLSGAWGKLTLGMQNNPYMNARHWDQTYLYGGAFGASYRHEGVNYSMSNGPFSLNVMAMAQGENEDSEMPGDIAGPVRGTSEVSGDDGIDGWIIHAGYDFGVVALNVSHHADNLDLDINGAEGDTDATRAIARADNNVAADAASRDRTAVGVNGSVGPADWYLAYETTEQNVSGDGYEENDTSSIGGFVGFRMSENDTLYGYYVAHSGDRAGGGVGEDFTETIVGYSRAIGPGVRFIAEYQSLDRDLEGKDMGSDTSNLALAIRYVF